MELVPIMSSSYILGLLFQFLFKMTVYILRCYVVVLQHNFRANLHLKGTIGLLVLVIDFYSLICINQI